MSDPAGTVLVPGEGTGPVLALAEPLSFWGGFDPATGQVIDRLHADLGRCCTGSILMMRASRGSSSGSSVLAEAIRAGTGPAAILLVERDPILVVGAMVAGELYGRSCPIVLLAEARWRSLSLEPALRVDARTRRPRIEPLPWPAIAIEGRRP